MKLGVFVSIFEARRRRAMTETSGLGPLELANWRAATAELYSEVRRRSERDPRGAWDEFRWARGRMFRTHPQSPLERVKKAGFREMPSFPYDPSWRVRVPVVALAEGAGAAPRRMDLAEGSVSFHPFATVTFTPPAGPSPAMLTLYWIDGYGGGLFLPFKDLSNGAETYGGGRYLYDTIKGADLGVGQEEMILDFNFAYNPSCAYSPRWVCPLAPAENSLPFRVEAGERVLPEE
jgi:uncharacterized protein